MPVDIEFVADENLIVATWTNPTTHSDFTEAFKVAHSAYSNATSTIHTIYIASGLTQLPANSISTYLRNPDSPLRHKMAGCFVVVADNSFIRAIVETAGKVSRNPRVYVAPSVEEARLIIAEMSGKFG